MAYLLACMKEQGAIGVILTCMGMGVGVCVGVNNFLCFQVFCQSSFMSSELSCMWVLLTLRY